MPILEYNAEKKFGYTMRFGTYFFQLFFIIPLLLSCEGKTPEDFDREFNEKYNACVDRAKLRCDSDMNTETCELMANERCQSFLGTSDNPIVK
ncbi:MAG: hypothetical protein Ct9H300mP6_06470 [Gammaproteobacteria bacterium]|nr:MAG: hypothetical protein CM1200mP17_17580 [Woeseia sp.]GIT36779.1 MAG: hypothetical protein Ct9H300mP6_06470 [Gammaproteobacteria bacterium]